MFHSNPICFYFPLDNLDRSTIIEYNRWKIHFWGMLFYKINPNHHCQLQFPAENDLRQIAVG